MMKEVETFLSWVIENIVFPHEKFSSQMHRHADILLLRNDNEALDHTFATKTLTPMLHALKSFLYTY